MKTEITEALKARLSDAEVEVVLEGNKAYISVVSAEFAPLGRVQRQQKVYACIDHLIADGRLHAVTIRAVPPDENR